MTNVSADLRRQFQNMYGLDDNTFEIWQLLFPLELENRLSALNEGTRFAHYTTAENALNILRGQNVWLRNAVTMNDYSEVQYGIDKLVNFFGLNRETSKAFWKALDGVHPGATARIVKQFDDWVHDLRMNTYLICISKHHPSEDRIGRLSMWRAYGRTSGVALVLNGGVFHSTSQALEAFSYPVSYKADVECTEIFSTLADTIVKRIELLKSSSADDFVSRIHTMFENFALCLKHPGFAEEQEWRVVYRPNQSKSAHMKSKIVPVRGVPQRVYELPLREIPDEGLVGASLPNLIDRIIIGPTTDGYVMWDALVSELGEAGVAEPEKKVVLSDIPLRG